MSVFHNKGIQVAKRNGIKFGRPKLEQTKKFHQFKEVYAKVENGQLKAVDGMKELGMTKASWCILNIMILR